MEKLRIAPWVAVLFAVPGLIACTDEDATSSKPAPRKL